MRINRHALVVLPLACLALAACDVLPTSPYTPGSSAPAGAQAEPVSAASTSAIVALTNQTRTAAGLSPLAENAALDRDAAILCSEIAQTGVWSHEQTGTAYPAPQDRATAVGYTWRALGENLAMTTTADAQHVFNNWMNSPEHRDNILETSYSEIGVAQQQIGGSVCSVQVFGAR
jgi:uncharacterized protein YkwD